MTKTSKRFHVLGLLDAAVSFVRKTDSKVTPKQIEDHLIWIDSHLLHLRPDFSEEERMLLQRLALVSVPVRDMMVAEPIGNVTREFCEAVDALIEFALKQKECEG